MAKRPMNIALRQTACGTLLAAIAVTHAAAQPVGPLPKDELQVLATAFHELRLSLVERPDDRALIISTIKGLLRGADPESGEYLTSEELEAYRQPRGIDLEGIGAEIRIRDGQFILAPRADGPAAQAGIVFADQLLAVDGVRMKGLDASRVAKTFVGPPSTTVTLTVFRESTLSVHAIQVERRAFTVHGALISRPAPGVVQLRVPYFDASAVRQAADALRDAWRAEPFQGLILDLRGCPGGLLESTVGVAAMFLPKDALVVRTAGANPESNVTYRATPAFYNRRGGTDPLTGLPPELQTMPIAVLVDNATTSGGEIVAAALQDHKRATLIGRPTFGRASIQTLRPLQMGAIKFTSSHYYPPSGRKIQGVGVTPDKTIEDPSGQEAVRLALTALKTRSSEDAEPSAQAIQNKPPSYPDESKRKGEQGRVVVNVMIDVHGRASNAAVHESSGYPLLDQAAIEAVQNWSFVPRRRNGVPEAMEHRVPINFVLQ